MKKLVFVLAVAALLMIVGLGCSSKSKDKTSGGGGTLTLTSYASPPGALRENSQLPMDVALGCNRAGALIYYVEGGGDPTTSSSIYNAASPLTIDAGYADGTYIVKYFAWYKDPDTGNFEQECPPPDGFHTDTYMFKPDIKKPTVKIEPPGGAFGDPASVTITITASDPPNTPDTCTIYYETTDDGTDPPDPTTSSTSGPGDGTTVAWTGGTLKIAAIAVDAVGNESTVAYATFSIDQAQAPYIVLEKINDAREALGYDRLSMDGAFAGGCAAHCKKIWDAENGTGTLIIPAGKDSEGLIPYWYEETDNRQLIDWDSGDSIGFYITMLGGKTHFPMGMHAGSADEFFTQIQGMASLWDELMKEGPPLPIVGIGCYENVWEIIVANPAP